MELARYTASDGLGLAAAARGGDVSIPELITLARRACELVNPCVNAVLELFDEPRISHLSRQGTRGRPFYGVPLMIKDVGEIEEGRIAESGSLMLHGHRATRTSTLMRRIWDAGFINVGRTAASEFAITATVETAANGSVRNPWDLSRSSAGSSGGAAAAVAAGIVPVAHGTDGGGSIRLPAAACGVVGLKPSRGLVPADGYDAVGGLGVQFAITRTVRDTAALLDAISTPPSGYARSAVPGHTYLDATSDPPSTLRIGVLTEDPRGTSVDPEVAQSVRAVAGLLDDCGHQVLDLSWKFDADRFYRATAIVWSAVTATAIQNLQHAVDSRRPPTIEGFTRARAAYGRTLTAGDLVDALNAHDAARAELAETFDGCDAILTPTTPLPPLPLGTYDPDATVGADWYYSSELGATESITSIFNCTGQPAISLPLAETATGLPIGVQLATRLGEERTLLRLSSYLERVLPWEPRLHRLHKALRAQSCT